MLRSDKGPRAPRGAPQRGDAGLMGDVIDFKSARERLAARRAEEAGASEDGEEFDLEYDPKPGSVGVKLSEGPDGTARFTVTAPAADVAEAVGMARSALMASFGVDASDLRTAEAVRSQLGDAAVDAYVTSFVQQHFFALALQRAGVLPFLTPDFLTTEAPVQGRDYVFRAETLLRPSMELTSYGPVSVERPEKREVTSKDVTEYLANMADELATWEDDPSRAACQRGDRVLVNLDASDSSGRPIPGLSGRHMPYDVGAGALGDEFDRQLEGMAPGQRKSFTTSAPSFSPEGAGFEAMRVKVQLDSVQRKVPARIDDKWVAANMPEAQTLLGLRGRVRTLLEREAEDAYRDELMARTADALSERLVGEPDERYQEKMEADLAAQYEADLASRGISFQELAAQPGFDMDAWKSELAEQARGSLRRGLALDALADHLDIQLTQADIAKVVARMAPGRAQEALQGIIDSGQMPKMCEVALRTKANEWLVDHLDEAGRPDGQRFEGGVILGGAETGKDGGRAGRRPDGDGPHLQLV